MANLLKSKITSSALNRNLCSKTKLKVFPQSNSAKFDDVPQEPAKETYPEPEDPPKELYDYTNAVRYKVCQERVPVHKVVHTTPASYEQVNEALNLQRLQPALLPDFYSKSD